MKNLAVWRKGKTSELAFWRSWLTGKKEFCERVNRLSSRFDFIIGDKKEISIANLGAGPVCLIGNVRRDIKATVVSSDLLAKKYKRLLKELGIKASYPSEYQDITKLTYKDGTFDIAYCSNMLDHCQNPYKALKEIVRIVRPGGWIYLQHIAHEGKRRGYHNMHQWNLDITTNADCIIWNKADFGKKTFLLSDIYKGFKTEINFRRQVAFITSYAQKNG